MLLSGCSLTGEVVIHESGRVDVDLEYTSRTAGQPLTSDAVSCQLDNAGIDTLGFMRIRRPDGTTMCRVTGWALVGDLQRAFGFVRRVGDRFAVEYYPGGPVTDPVAEFAASRVERLDVTVVFPGPVEEHLGGLVDGRVVRWDDRQEFIRHRGLSAVGAARMPAAEASGAPGWLAPATGGLGAGLVLGLLIGRGHRRHARSDEDWSRP